MSWRMGDFYTYHLGKEWNEDINPDSVFHNQLTEFEYRTTDVVIGNLWNYDGNLQCMPDLIHIFAHFKEYDIINRVCGGLYGTFSIRMGIAEQYY